jgi:hypothetical protein
MNELTLYQELANIIFYKDKSIKVIQGDSYLCNIEESIIEIGGEPFQDIEDSLQPYLLLDMGFNYIDYCSTTLYSFIHELGHMVNGWVNPLEYYAFTDYYEDEELTYDIIKQYLSLDDEIYANEWAMDFIKSNKKYITKLDKELLYAK